MRTLVFLLCSCALFGQSFDVASIRPAAPGSRGGRGNMAVQGNTISLRNVLSMVTSAEGIEAAPGSVIMRGATLASVFKWAYSVEEYQVSGPAWLSSTRFDIVAKSAGPAEVAQLRVMMQNLLAERFGAVVHRISKELPAYVLSQGKGGSKLKASATEGDGQIKQAGLAAVSGKNVELGDIVKIMAVALKAPVADQTGLGGKYDFNVDLMSFVSELSASYKPGDAPPDPATIIAQVLQQTFGLKLEARKAPVEILVIDKIEKTPTEN
jgi:uncharacterized protein (TIGR03435 family)